MEKIIKSNLKVLTSLTLKESNSEVIVELANADSVPFSRHCYCGCNYIWGWSSICRQGVHEWRHLGDLYQFEVV